MRSWSARAAQSMLAALAVLAVRSCNSCAAAAEFLANCCFLGSARWIKVQGCANAPESIGSQDAVFLSGPALAVCTVRIAMVVNGVTIN